MTSAFIELFLLMLLLSSAVSTPEDKEADIFAASDGDAVQPEEPEVGEELPPP